MTLTLEIWLIAGMLETDGNERYNAAVLLSPEGMRVGKYRKHKLEHELVRNTPGSETPALDTLFGKIGIMICADRREAELVKRLCESGATLLICPSGGMFGPKSNDHILQARSIENRVTILFVHPAEFLVTDPQGKILAQTVLGDQLEIEPGKIGSNEDQNEVLFFDLPLRQAKP